MRVNRGVREVCYDGWVIKGGTSNLYIDIRMNDYILHN